jgi:alpha-ketoglutarate-dependent taurine dioxygenase
MGHYDVTVLDAPFGAEVRGLDSTAVPQGAQLDELRQLLDDHVLLVFPDVEDLSYGVQTRLTAAVVGHEDRLAQAAATSGVPIDEKPPSYVSNREAGSQAPYGRLLFHTDMMWADEPCHALSLYGVEVEQPAVPTTFAGAARGWETLPADLRSRVQGLTALQLTGTKMREVDDDLLMSSFTQDFSTITPIENPHPRTGRPLLFVSQGNTEEIVGMDEAASEELLGELFDHLYAPQNLYAHPWRTGDLVVWDNLAVQHARANVKADGPTRTLQKVFSPADVGVKVGDLSYSRID